MKLEIALRNERGLLVRDFVPYTPAAATRELRKLTRRGIAAQFVTLDGVAITHPRKGR